MKSVFACLMVLLISQGAAIAAPECAVIVDGQINTQMECHPYEPYNTDHAKSMRCFNYAGLIVIVDYTLNDQS